MSKPDTTIVGIDIGATKIAVCLATAQGQILVSERFPCGDYGQSLAQMVTAVKKLAQGQGIAVTDLAAGGICAPGPLDTAKGLIFKSPNMSWDAVPVRDDLQKALGIPFILENDANAGVLAEWYFGSAQGKRDVIYLTMSTGIGGGIISNGQLVTGHDGNAGELGHVCLDLNGPLCGCGLRGCLEAFCGGKAVARRLQTTLKDWPDHAMFKLPCVDGKLENLNFRALLDGAKAGIPLAREMWDEYCLRLAQGIGTILLSFNPESLILGTVAYHAGEFMLNPVRSYLPRFTWPQMLEHCDIRLSSLGLKIGELAGSAIAMRAAQQAGRM